MGLLGYKKILLGLKHKNVHHFVEIVNVMQLLFSLFFPFSALSGPNST